MAFIIKPLVTEKMTKITDKQPNRYGFVVIYAVDRVCALYERSLFEVVLRDVAEEVADELLNSV